jgi:hypothetical protein
MTLDEEVFDGEMMILSVVGQALVECTVLLACD